MDPIDENGVVNHHNIQRNLSAWVLAFH